MIALDSLPGRLVPMMIPAAVVLIAMLTVLEAGHSAGKPGEKIVKTVCFACHQGGIAGAPKLGVEADWTKRREQGMDALVKNALEGYKGMPPKGGNSTLTAQQVKDAVAYMIALLPAQANTASTETEPTAGKPEDSESSAVKKETAKQMEQKTVQPKVATVNTFNRLMKPKSERNPPPTSDGIHDPGNEGTQILQPPGEAFSDLPKGKAGNYIDWVKALEDGHISPRYDRLDENVKPIIMDLNIVREVKGTMPNVVYPHKQHTEWLDCSNCHPALFVPKKGGNQISMAAILLGQKCGVCHGKVAFPVSDCRRCHSQKKSASLK